MASYVSTYGDVLIGYDDSWQHPCGAPKKDGAPCKMLIKNGQEHCRWHTPGLLRTKAGWKVYRLEKSRAYYLRQLEYTKQKIVSCQPESYSSQQSYKAAMRTRWKYLKQWTESLEEAEKALAELRESEAAS